MSTERRQRIYDHRLIRLVRETGDASIATGLGSPRSTVEGWLRRTPQTVTSIPDLDASAGALRVRVAWLENRVARLMAVLRVLFAVVRVRGSTCTRSSMTSAGASWRGVSTTVLIPARRQPS